MNAFDEFAKIARLLEENKIPYAVVGGVALAFHGHPRFTQDIDLIVGSENLQDLTGALASAGYRSFTKPWSLGNTGLILYRFLKPSSEDELILDVLEGTADKFKAMIGRSLIAKGETGEIRVARKEDLIYLKRLRNSLQDQADIQKLSNENS